MIKKSVLLTALAIAGFAVTSLAQTVPNYVPSNGLVGWWPFNGNATDESINTNDGTVNGATLTADRFGNANSAYSFNGNNGVNIIVQDAINLRPQNFTLNAWVFISGATMWNQIMSKRIASNNTNSYAIIEYGGSVFGQNTSEVYNLVTTTNGTQQTTINTNTITLGSWNMLTGSFDGNSIKFYVNGQLTSNSNFSGIIQYTSDPLFFGTSGYFTGQNLIGILDDIGIWNRALTQSEITNLYNGNICYQTITVTDTLLINTNLTGFNPVTYQNTIKIWPNPTNDHITIDNGNLANLTGHQLKISNALGQQVFQSAITQQQFYVDMSTWGGNGIYFVNLINAQGVTIETRKIVLQ
jgi:hypothetical protein